MRLIERNYVITAFVGSHPDVDMDASATFELQSAGIQVHNQLKLWYVYLKNALKPNNMPDKIIYIGVRQIILGLVLILLFRKSEHILVFSGLGGIFHAKSKSKKLFSALLHLVIRTCTTSLNVKAIVQNSFDKEYIQKNLKINNTLQVKGSGVNLKKFQSTDFDNKKNEVIFAGRILREKGILEFIEACTKLRSEFPNWKFRIFGGIYEKNPSAISKTQLHQLLRDSGVEYCGHSNSLEMELMQAKVFCLPSYHEGFPKVIMEACAAGCVIITSDAPGCAATINSEVHGKIVKVQDTEALVDAIRQILEDPEKQMRFGRNARALAVNQYDIRAINEEIVVFIGS